MNTTNTTATYRNGNTTIALFASDGGADRSYEEGTVEVFTTDIRAAYWARSCGVSKRHVQYSIFTLKGAVEFEVRREGWVLSGMPEDIARTFLRAKPV